MPGIDDLVSAIEGENYRTAVGYTPGLQIIGALQQSNDAELRDMGNALAAARRVDKKAVLLSAPKNLARRVQVLGVPATVVGIGATETIEIKTQQLFIPKRFVVGDVIAPDFVINQIKIATQDQFLSSDGCPAEAFQSDAVDLSVEFDTLQPGNSLFLTVTNLNAAARTFRGAFFGTSVLPG
jgi:hypothetical protein